MTNQEKLKGKYIRFEDGQQNPIEFLESIGGKLNFHMRGTDNKPSGYYIDNNGYISSCYIETYPTITVNEAKALLNESELKVGDWVNVWDTEEIKHEGKLLAILPEGMRHRYIVTSKIGDWNCFHHASKIKTVKPSKQDIANLMGLPVDSIDFSKL